MKKFLICLIVSIFVSPCNCAVVIQTADGSDNNLDYLRNEIKKLENELNSKKEKLNKCASKNKNFQIAGIATVGLATVRVATNISLNSKIKDQKKSVENMNGKIKMSDVEADKFLSDAKNWSQNLDPEKFYEECQKENITDADFQRIKQKIDQNDFVENITESDKIIMEKILRAARKSQKEQKE